MRKFNLDILRGLAVLLVLFRHSNLSYSNMIKHIGWLGVDLFFVLSGYLISNILFTEYKEKQDINASRFLIRRAFKIFPPFYIFMITTLLVEGYLGSLTYNWHQYVSEAFYLQSYLPGIWLHTWSLAVEEHFYFSFVFIMLWLVKKDLLNQNEKMITAFGAILLISFMMRFMAAYPHRQDEFYGFMQTHLRLDGILIGILISYLLNFTSVKPLLIQYRWIIFSLGLFCIVPSFFYKAGSYFMNTVGLSIVNIGFGLFTMLALVLDDFTMNKSPLVGIIFKPIAFCGEKSYSIYLCHLNSKDIVCFLFSFDPNTMCAIYIVGSFLIGIAMSYLIEKPFERLRDRFLLLYKQV